MDDQFDLAFSEEANKEMAELKNDPAKSTIAKAVIKSLKYMAIDLKHPSLNTHKYAAIKGPHGEEEFESYAQNNTPGAYRIFWHYGEQKKQITILKIIPHP